MTKYRIYIDEVGNSDLNSSNLKDHRFLCLTGVIIELNEVASVVQPALDQLKGTFFKSDPDEPVVLHRKEILYKKGPFSVLKDKKIEESFNKALLDLLESWNYFVIAVVIDKEEHNSRYSTWKYDPYHYCQEIIIERYRLFLNINKAVGDVMFESRGGKEDMRLKTSFRKLMDCGTHNISSEQLLDHITSKELKIKSKLSNIAGLQIADLLAHPSRRWAFKNLMDMDEGRNTFSDEILSIMERKKFFRYLGKINGYGVKKLP
jgi:hypothetical protein